MTTSVGQTKQLELWVDRLKAGDASAREELLRTACDRLTKLTRRMLRGFPRVKRWEETDDVLQNASLRLYRTLEQVTPETVRDFLRLAALNIRRELLDLAKRHYGPLGLGANYATQGEPPSGDSVAADRRHPQDLTNEPSRVAAWAEFHRCVDQLPDDEREVFDLLWYQGMAQAEAAALLDVSVRTIKRRWQSARLKLYEALGGELPDE